MNVAQYYAGQDYGSGAIARFNADLQCRPVAPFPQPRRIVPKTAPLRDKPIQKAAWNILLNAEEELLSGEVCDRMPKKYQDKQSCSIVRSLLAYWSRSRYLVRKGTERTYTYRIKEQG